MFADIGNYSIKIALINLNSTDSPKIRSETYLKVNVYNEGIESNETTNDFQVI
jgi:hypothetical protein